LSDEITTIHEAFGMVEASRISGGFHMFGSDNEHGEVIEIRVKQGKHVRNLNTDWFYDFGRPYLTFRMTEAQFVAMVTGLSMKRVPCTIYQSRDGEVKLHEAMPKPEGKTATFQREFKARAARAVEKVAEAGRNLTAILNQKSVSKTDVREALHLVDVAHSDVKSNMPFVVECFEENLEQRTHEAKLDIETHVQMSVVRLGMEALGKRLEEGEGIRQIVATAKPAALPAGE